MKYLDEYVTSSFGVNIGTGLMLESILKPTDDRIDDDRLVPNNVKISDYNTYYINLYSLLVNIAGSFSATSIDELLKNDKTMINVFLERAISEMVMIQELIDIDVVYYNMLYGPYDRKKLLKESTNKDSKTYKLKKAISNMVSLVLASKEVKVEEVDIYLPKKKKSLISTSNTMDLLNSNKMDLDLLEFHTGVLKQRNKFYTKVNTKVELPFEEVLLFAFGDKKGLINPILNIKERKVLLDALVEKKLKPYNRYSRGFIMDIVKDVEVVSKLKQIPSLF